MSGTRTNLPPHLRVVHDAVAREARGQRLAAMAVLFGCARREHGLGVRRSSLRIAHQRRSRMRAWAMRWSRWKARRTCRGNDRPRLRRLPNADHRTLSKRRPKRCAGALVIEADSIAVIGPSVRIPAEFRPPGPVDQGKMW